MAHDDQTKAAALEMYLAGRSLAHISRELDVSENTLRRWRDHADETGKSWREKKAVIEARAIAAIEKGRTDTLTREIGRTDKLLEEIFLKAKDSIDSIPASQIVYVFEKFQRRLLELRGELPDGKGNHLFIVGSTEAAFFCNALIAEIEGDPVLGPAWRQRQTHIKNRLKQLLSAIKCSEPLKQIAGTSPNSAKKS